MTESIDSPAPTDVHQWIKELMDRDNLDATNFARRYGIGQSIISRFLSGETHMLSPKTLAKLATHSPVPLPKDVKSVLDRRPDLQNGQNVNYFVTEDTGMPIWGVIPFERDGVFKMNPVPLSVNKRPFIKGASRKIIAFYAPDETMAPRWHQGEPVIVDLMRPAKNGNCALIVLSNTSDPNGEELYLLRQVFGRSNGSLRISSFAAPETEEKIPLQRVLDVHRIIEWEDLLP